MFALIDRCGDYKIMPAAPSRMSAEARSCKVESAALFLGTSLVTGSTVGPRRGAWTLVSGDYKRNVGRWRLTRTGPQRDARQYVLPRHLTCRLNSVLRSAMVGRPGCAPAALNGKETR